jgi:hypothetical protein
MAACSKSSMGREMAVEKAMDQRLHLIELVFPREMPDRTSHCSRFDESKKIVVELPFMGDRQPMGRSRINLQRRILDEFRRQQR